MKKAVIILNGELDSRNKFYSENIEKYDIYCADGGANHAYRLNIDPLEIWGDLDSITDENLKYYRLKKYCDTEIQRRKR